MGSPFVIKAGADHGFLRITIDSHVDCADYSMALLSVGPEGSGQLAAVNLTVLPSS
jgi:hypothetical protein